MTNANGSTAGRGAAQSVHRAETALAATIFTLGMACFAVFASRTSTGGMAVASACVMFAALFGPCCGLSVMSWTASLSAWLSRAPGLRCSLLWIISVVIFVIYTLLIRAPISPFLAARLAGYGLLPILLVASPPTDAGEASRSGDWRVLAAFAAIWLPAEFRIMGGVHLPAGVPGGLDAARLLIVDLALVLFLAARPLPGIGYTFRLGRRDLAAAGLAFALFAAVAIPLG